MFMWKICCLEILTQDLGCITWIIVIQSMASFIQRPYEGCVMIFHMFTSICFLQQKTVFMCKQDLDFHAEPVWTTASYIEEKLPNTTSGSF